MRKLSFLILLLTFFNCSFAQKVINAINFQYTNNLYSVIYKKSETEFTFNKPLLIKPVSDTAWSICSSIQEKKLLNYFHRKLLHENLWLIDSPQWKIRINPLFHIEYGRELSQSDYLFQNTRGIEIAGNIGSKIPFFTRYYENQVFLPDYLNKFVKKYRIIPGSGVGRSFKDDGFDYAWAEAALTFSPSRFFDITLGNGKNFMGDGYRSMLLSDNSCAYPYLRLQTNLGKIQYTNLYTILTNLESGAQAGIGYPKKYASFHSLSLILGKRFQLSVFEAIIWQQKDSNQYRGFELSYLNPIILYHPINYSLGSPDNALLGMNLKVKLWHNIHLYSQLLIDDFYFQKLKSGTGFFQNKIAAQIGLRAFNAFGINNLHLLGEFNTARPYVYAHKYPEQSYTNNNQALAHPLGANFHEIVFIGNYSKKRWFSSLKIIGAVYGTDSAKIHFGKDIFRSDFEAPNGIESFNNKTTQGLKTNLVYLDVNTGLLLNPKTNMNFMLGYIYRYETNSIESNKTGFIYLAFKTSLGNFYADF